MKWAGFALVLVCAGLVACGAWLLTTPGGTNWLASQFSARVPGLSIEGAGGRLVETVTLDELRYRNNSVDLLIRGARVQLDVAALFDRRLSLPLVAANAVEVVTRASSGGSQSEVTFNMPWQLDVQRLLVGSVSVRVGEAAPLDFKGVEASGELFRQDLRVNLVGARHDMGFIAGDFALEFVRHYPFSGSAVVDGVPVPLEEFQQLVVSYDGSTEGVAIDAAAGPALARAAFSFGSQTTLTASATIGSFQQDGFAVNQFELGAKGPLDDLELGVTAEVIHALGRAALDIGLRLQPGVLLIEQLKATGSEGHLALAGSVNLPRQELRAAFDGVLLDKAFAGNAVVSGRDRRDIGGTVYVHQDSNWAVMVISPSTGLSVNGVLNRLADVYPGLAGVLTFVAQLSFEDERFELAATAARLAWDEWEARQIAVTATGRVLGQLTAEVKVPELVRAGEPLGNGVLGYTGTREKGAVSLAWQHPQGALDASLLRDGTSLSLQKGRLRSGAEDWRLVSPAPLVIEAQQVKVGDQCWAAEPARVCLSNATFGAGTGAVTIAAGELTRAGIQLRSLSADLSYGRVGQNIEASASGVATLDAGARDVGIEFAGHANADRIVLDQFSLAAAEMVLQGNAAWTKASARLRAEVNGTRLGKRVVAVADVGTRPVDGTISISLDGETIFSLQPGETGITANLMVSDLALLFPDASGSLNGTGSIDRVSGNWQLQLDSPALTYNDNRLQALVLTARGRGQQLGDGRLTTSDWQTGAYSLGSGALTLKGDLNGLALGLDWQYAGNRVSAVTEFSLQDSMLRGRLQSATVAGPVQKWVVEPGAAFEFSDDRGQVDDHCWRYDNASLCLAGLRLERDSLDFSVALKDAPVRLRDIYYAPETRLDGHLSTTLAGRVTGLTGSPNVNARFSVRVPEGELAYFDQTLPWTLAGEGTITNNQVRSSLVIESDARNRFQVNANWPTLLGPDRFQLEAMLASNSLGVITAFVPQLDRAAGTIGAKLSLDTRGGSPTGRFSLDVGEDASVVVPVAGITLEDVTLHAEGNEELVTLTFGASSGNGQVKGTGQVVDPLSAERDLKLNLSGENFVAVQRPELSVTASPALEFHYQGSGTAQLAGHLDVTGGNFRLEDLGVNPRRVSSDVTVLSRKIPNQAFYQLDVGVGLSINNFAIDMYGLRGRVDGGLSLVQRPRLPRRLIGTVNLRDGSFTRYGQDFAVERGRLIFAGPINNPIVDVVSSRSIDSADELIKVSLILSGPANNIRSQLVSSPAMSEAQALSYLVLGRSLRGASAADGQSISLAALSLGIKGVAPVTDQLKSALGLTELTLESRGVDGAMVIAGKQINPGLYVEYSYDVLGRVGGILFSYQLNDKFSLETRTGEDNSMQIIYRLE
ncbi:MAG: translocation/assembly module TamB domain-containing protein [Pseudomonadota bacterium]